MPGTVYSAPVISGVSEALSSGAQPVKSQKP